MFNLNKPDKMFGGVIQIQQLYNGFWQTVATSPNDARMVRATLDQYSWQKRGERFRAVDEYGSVVDSN